MVQRKHSRWGFSCLQFRQQVTRQKTTAAPECKTKKLVKHFGAADSGCVKRSLWDVLMRSQRGGVLGKKKKKKVYFRGDVSPNCCSVPGKSRSRTKTQEEEENSDLFPPAMIPYEIFNPSESSAFISHFKKKKKKKRHRSRISTSV